MSGGGEYAGTPFDDTFIDAPGNYTINGGGGQDNFQINLVPDEVLFSLSSSHQLEVSTYDDPSLRAAATVASDNSGGTEVASFKVEGNYPWSRLVVGQEAIAGAVGRLVVIAPTADILFQNTSSGQATIWDMNGGALIGGGPVSPNAGPAWKAIGPAISMTTALPTSCGRTRAPAKPRSGK